MIIMILLVVLEILITIACIFSNKLEYTIPFSITSIFIVFICGLSCIMNHTSYMIKQKTVELRNTYEILSEYKDSERYAKDIIDYNTKVQKMKIRSKSVWTNWFINPAYEDAKLIEVN